MGLADLFLLKGDESQALENANNALEENNNDLLIYSTRGNIYMVFGNFNQAEEDFWKLMGESEPQLRYLGLNGLIDLSLV